MYAESNGHYPPAYQLGPDGHPWHSWRVLILPYINGEELFKQYRFDEPWNGPNNRTLADHMPKTLAYTGAERGTTTNYLAVVGKETMWPGAESRKRADIKDGLGDTILIVENNGLGVHWMEPRDLLFDTMPLEIDHPYGISSWYKFPAVVTADDSVRRISKDMSPDALRAALTPSRPWLEDVELSDFKVRLLAPGGTGEGHGTDAVTRVLVESTDHDGSWTTVGVHGNVVEASWLALVDALAYAARRARAGTVPQPAPVGG